MASALMRRSALTAALAAAATVASPLVGLAHAAAFAATGITSAPAPDTSTTPQTVESNRPTVTATFNAPLAGTSSLTLVKKGDSLNLCAGSTVSGSSVSCTPSQPLTLGQTYDAVGHGVSGDGSHADSATFEFQPSYPSYASSIPTQSGSLVKADSNNPISITWKTRKGLDKSKSQITVRDFIGGQPANPVQGATTFSSSGGPLGSTDTISFAPASGLTAGSEYQVVSHVEETGQATSNPAVGDTTFVMFVQNAAPSSLATAAPFANNVNDTAFHFTGVAGAGQTVTVTVSGTAVSGHLPTTKTGTATASTCGQATCSWNAAVDISGLDDGDAIAWSAEAADDNGNKTVASNGPTFVKDTTAPSKPVPAASFPTPTKLNVTAPDPDGSTKDVASYIVTITDTSTPARTFGPKSFDATDPSGADSLDTTIDVSGLNDGQLIVSVVAVDAHGNQSAAGTVKPVKNVGNTPDFDASTLTSGGNDLSLPTTESHPIQSPTKVTIVFSQNVKPTWTDKSKPADGPNGVVNNSGICVEDTNSNNGTNCQNGATTFPQGNVMQTTIPGDLFDAAGYHVWVTAWPAAFCADVTFPSTPNANCKAFSANVTDPSSGQEYTFAVDDTPPAVPTITAPSVIDANGIPTVLQGTAEKNSTVVLAMHSSNGGNQTASTVADDGGHWQKIISQWALPDGTLTIDADAIDAAGNNSAANGHGTPSSAPLLAARPSAPRAVGVVPNGTQATFVWQPPTYFGGTNRTVTDYVVTLTDTTVGGTSSIDQAHSPQTLGPLTPGHAYTASVYASNGVPCPCNSAATHFVAKYQTVLSSAAPRVITYGSFIAVQGKLTYAGLGLPGKPITITSTYYNGSHGPTYHVTTDQNGSYAVAGLKPLKNITYVATFAGDTAYNASSHAAGVAVRVAIKISKVTARSTSHTSPVTMSGTVAPNFHGYRVYIYEVRSGKLVKLGSATLSSKSTWSFAHTFSKGKHFVIAKFFGRSGNATNQTGQVKIVRS